MRAILTLVFVSSLMMCARAQTWSGKYEVDPAVCDPTRCCCFTQLITVTRPTGSILAVNGPMNGTECGGGNAFTYDGYYPAGYVTVFNMGSLTYTATLSADSRTIDAFNAYKPFCSSKGLRIGSVPTTSTKATSGNEKLAISSMGMVSGIFLVAINCIVH